MTEMSARVPEPEEVEPDRALLDYQIKKRRRSIMRKFLLAAAILMFPAMALAQGSATDSTSFVITLPTDLTNLSSHDIIAILVPIVTIGIAFLVKYVKPLIPEWLIDLIPIIGNAVLGLIGVPTNIATMLLVMVVTILIQRFTSQGLTRSAGAVQYLPTAGIWEKLGFKSGKPRVSVTWLGTPKQ
jgi:hypothetical protein